MANLIGQKLGQYQITSLLGKGGMATVYRARQTSMDRDVAIKVIKPDLAEAADFVTRFQREAKTIASLSHAHVLKVFDYGQQGDLVYLVMELLSGGSLADQIRRGPLPLDTVSRFLDQLASALDYAHGKGIIHRDLKPQNVLLDETGTAHLSDFGLAKILSETMALTQTGVAMGTPAYMPPEQWQGKPLDARADVYALGIMLFEMLAGRLPFVADTPFSLMHLHVSAPPPAVRSLRGDVPPAVEAVIRKALAKEPGRRYQSAGALAEAFKAALAKAEKSQDAVATVLSTVQQIPARRSLIAIAGAVIGLIVFALVIAGLANRGGIPAATATIQVAVGVNATQTATPPPATAKPTGGQPTAAPTTLVAPSPINTRATTQTVAAVAAATDTPVAVASFSPTPTPTATIPAVTSTAAPNIETLAAATFSARATVTAASFTRTPTPDMQQTLAAAVGMTDTAAAGATSTMAAFVSTFPALKATVTANKQWTPQIQSFEGVEMVLVPPGCFMMGSKTGGYGSETPATKICFDQPFWIDKNDVTNGQFRRFDGRAKDNSQWTGDNRPRETITWFEARDFCALRGARLPTEAEWEYVARGPDGLEYPWGNSWVAANAVYKDNSGSQTADVGSKPGGASWVGALDMSGNVWQWTSSIFQDYPYNKDDGRESNDDNGDRVLRGGSWDSSGDDLRSAFRGLFNPYDTFNWGGTRGFRCARPYDGKTLAATPVPVAQQLTIPTVNTNQQWTPQTQSFDGVEMALVPPGCFNMGNENGDSSDQKPATQICFDKPFWIDRYDVTNGQFKRFNGKAGRDSQWTGDNRPRESITWFEARDFCQLRGARLPTEAEWEYAARGPDGLLYPWGNSWIAANAVHTDNSGGQTADVGSKPDGASWVGALDKSGNVKQWTSSLYQPYPYNKDDGRESNSDTRSERVLRGGSYITAEHWLRAAYRSPSVPWGAFAATGFRCARSF